MSCSSFYICGVLCGSLVSVCSLHAGEVDDLIRLNATTVGLLHSFDVRFDVFECLRVQGFDPVVVRRFSDPRRDLSCRWLRESPSERVEFVIRSNTTGEVSDPAFNGGVFSTNGERVRVLLNWNPEEPPSLSEPMVNAPVKAMESPHTSNPAGFPPVRGYFLLEHARGLMAHPVPLLELVGSFKVVLVEVITTDNENEIYRLVLSEPHGFPGLLSYEVHLDPAVGCLARRAIVRERVKKIGERVTTREVTRFKSLGDGVFFPVEAKQTTQHPAKHEGPMSEVLMRVTQLSVNEFLSEDAFALPFPEHALVHRYEGGRETHQLWLWGKHDKPDRHITSDEYQRMVNESRPVRTSRGRRWVLIVIAMAFAVVLAGFYYRLFRRKANSH